MAGIKADANGVVIDSDNLSTEALYNLLKRHPIPPRARARLMLMRSQAESNIGASNAHWDRRQSILGKIQKLKVRRDRALESDDREAFQEQIDEAEREWAEVAATKSVADFPDDDFSERITRDVVRLARSGAPLKDFTPALPDDPAGDDDALADVRAKIESLQREIKSLEHAVGDPKDIMARLLPMIEKWALAGTPSVSAFIHEDRQRNGEYRPSGNIELPRFYVGETRVMDAWGMMAWLFKDEIRKKFEEKIRAETKGRTIIPAAERAGLIKQIETNVLVSERVEAALVWRMQEAGRSDVKQRRNISVKAFLGIKAGKLGSVA